MASKCVGVQDLKTARLSNVGAQASDEASYCSSRLQLPAGRWPLDAARR